VVVSAAVVVQWRLGSAVVVRLVVPAIHAAPRVKTLSPDARRGRCRWRDDFIPFLKATSGISTAYPASAGLPKSGGIAESSSTLCFGGGRSVRTSFSSFFL
jgi:hypothetical protein